LFAAALEDQELFDALGREQAMRDLLRDPSAKAELLAALDAPVNQGTEVAQGYEHNYDKLLPSLEVKYSINPELSVYAQAAEGFLAPNLKDYYTTGINSQSLKPQSTLNFQTGFAYQDEHLALGGDIYDIHFQNFVQSHKLGGVKIFYNSGGAFYRGIEGEATYTFDDGFSFFGNAGYNQAYYTSLQNGPNNAYVNGVYVSNAPQFTSNVGIIYDKDGIYGSIIDQWTGGSYSGTNGIGSYANSPAIGKSPGGWYDPYNIVNLAAGYTFNHLNPNLTQVKLKLNLDNITDQKQVIGDNGTNNLGQTLYWVLPGTSAFVTLSVPVNF